MRPRFLSQKIEAKEPEKKIPSTAANATRRSAKVEFASEIQRRAQAAFLRMHGTIGGREGSERRARGKEREKESEGLTKG
jgi:hypothetical protein